MLLIAALYNTFAFSVLALRLCCICYKSSAKHKAQAAVVPADRPAADVGVHRAKKTAAAANVSSDSASDGKRELERRQALVNEVLEVLPSASTTRIIDLLREFGGSAKRVVEKLVHEADADVERAAHAGDAIASADTTAVSSVEAHSSAAPASLTRSAAGLRCKTWI